MPARPNPAVRREPRGIGTAGARDPLAREVRLLGSLLGQVIVEQEGLDLLELVERVRRRTIGAPPRRGPVERARLSAELDGLDLAASRGAHPLVRPLLPARQPGRGAAPGPDPPSARAGGPRRDPRRLGRRGASGGSGGPAAGSTRSSSSIGRLAIAPVLTAHPTEARRRTLLVALRRCHRLVERLDDPRLTPDEDRDIRRRLREEISLLWRTADLRSVAPTPLDEVRTAMTYFDETLFTVAPRLYRAVDGALDPLAAAERRRSLGRAGRLAAA